MGLSKKDVNPDVWAKAVMAAIGHERRIIPLSSTSVRVVNQPVKTSKSKGGR